MHFIIIRSWASRQIFLNTGVRGSPGQFRVWSAVQGTTGRGTSPQETRQEERRIPAESHGTPAFPAHQALRREHHAQQLISLPHALLLDAPGDGPTGRGARRWGRLYRCPLTVRVTAVATDDLGMTSINYYDLENGTTLGLHWDYIGTPSPSAVLIAVCSLPPYLELDLSLIYLLY